MTHLKKLLLLFILALSVISFVMVGCEAGDDEDDNDDAAADIGDDDTGDGDQTYTILDAEIVLHDDGTMTLKGPDAIWELQRIDVLPEACEAKEMEGDIEVPVEIIGIWEDKKAGIILVFSSNSLVSYEVNGQECHLMGDGDGDTWVVGDEWTLDWSDEFDDGVFDTNVWTRQVMLDPPNYELETYTGDESTAYEEDGFMVLKATHNGGVYDQPDSYTSARVISNPGGNDGTSGAEGKTFLYGKIAARIKLPGGKGIWPAFWMLGDNIIETGGDTNWPQCGEIDILESGGVDDPDYGQGTVHFTVHRDPGTETDPPSPNVYVPAGKYTLPGGALFKDDFHVFEIEWDPMQIVWKVDGVEYGSKDISSDVENEFHKPFYVLFNIAVGGWFTDAPDNNTIFPQYMYVDWIRYYKK